MGKDSPRLPAQALSAAEMNRKVRLHDADNDLLDWLNRTTNRHERSRIIAALRQRHADIELGV